MIICCCWNMLSIDLASPPAAPTPALTRAESFLAYLFPVAWTTLLTSPVTLVIPPTMELKALSSWSCCCRNMLSIDLASPPAAPTPALTRAESFLAFLFPVAWTTLLTSPVTLVIPPTMELKASSSWSCCCC